MAASPAFVIDVAPTQFLDVAVLVVVLSKSGDRDFAYALEQEAFQQQKKLTHVADYVFGTQATKDALEGKKLCRSCGAIVISECPTCKELE